MSEANQTIETLFNAAKALPAGQPRTAFLEHGLVVFNPATGEAIRRIDRKETGYIRENGGATWLTTDAWFSSSGDKIVAICESDGGYVVKVFETATGKTLHTLPAQKMAQTFRVRFAGEST